MTPEAVVYRYLEVAAQQPRDAARLAMLIGTDADLLGRWLTLLDCRADPESFLASVATQGDQQFQDLAAAQAWAVLAVSGSARLAFDQWQAVLNAVMVAEVLAEELEMPDPVAVRWRLLLASSGVSLPHDPLMVELLAFRGARPDLLEDASVIHRLFAVVEALDVLDAVGVQELVASLLGIEPGRFQTLHALADQRGSQLLRDLGLDGDADTDWAERLWLRLQMGILGHLFDGAERTDEGLGELHHTVSRSLFGSVPLLMRFDEPTQSLFSLDRKGPEISVGSSSSTIARSVRLGERSEFIDRSDQAVADRQVLRLLGSDDAVCYPLPDGAEDKILGVLVFALDEDVDQQAAMGLYAEELGRHLARKPDVVAPEQALLQRYRQREEKRLREIVHEANNPLAIVNNYLHILRLRFEQEPEAVEQLTLIGNELDRASEILQHVRELSDVDETATEAAVLFADVNLNELVATVVELHRGYAADHDVAISANQVVDQLVVSTDSQRLAQILNNLVRNAIEAAPGRSVMVGCAGGVFREGREGVIVTVTDTGPGLTREVLERLSEPKQSTKSGDHAGLGLHIVHRLVGELKGSIDVQTAPERGTTFTIFLPLAPL